MFSKRFLGLSAGALVLGLFVGAAPAGATGSVVAADPVTGEVGGALASCLVANGFTPNVQGQIYAAKPGVGVVHGQAFFFANRKDEMARLMGEGKDPKWIAYRLKKVNSGVTNPGIASELGGGLYEYGNGDNQGKNMLKNRQYLLASVTGRAGTFTGKSTTWLSGVPKFKGQTTVTASSRRRFAGAIGGNTLSSRYIFSVMRRTLSYGSYGGDLALLESLLARDIPAEEEALLQRGDLAERLFVTLANGFSEGRGDFRCLYPGKTDVSQISGPLPPNSKSSDMAWVRVDRPDGSLEMNLIYAESNRDNDGIAGIDAIQGLAQMYYECRVGLAPCVRNQT